MARSTLRAFIDGARQVLSVQLFLSIAAIALAGWTLGVTSELIRERDRLRERVIQLEQAMGANGLMTPEAPAVMDRPAPLRDTNVYPGEIGEARLRPASSEPTEGRNRIGAIFSNLFAPAPDLHVIVLHVRAEADRAEAESLAEALRQMDLEPHVRVLTPGDARESSYAYFDGRQSGAAADLVTRFHNLAREEGLAAWTAQLRGVALPARGEYTADRVDLILPPLPVDTPAAAAPEP